MKVITFLLISILTSSCGLSPKHADIDLQENLPEAKSTVFSQALVDLGLANKIFGQGKLKVMMKDVVDNTGTSLPTAAEMPNDITEMLKSALNGVGGNIFYIPYDPDFMINTATTGYSDWGNKKLPDVVLSGGITEFDRALITKGEGTNLSVEVDDKFPVSMEFGDQEKKSIASITLDFNLIDFDTFTGIPHMQAINNIKVHKALRNDSLGFTIYGSTIGVRGAIKKIQGRHEAIRLLVQLNMIQVLGRHQHLPYWKLLPGTDEDPVVINLITEEFYALKPRDRIAKVQEYLVLMDKKVVVTGILDSKTRLALKEVTNKNINNDLEIEQFLAVYRQVPLDASSLSRRTLADSMIATYKSLKPGSITLSTNQAEYNIDEHLLISFTVDKPMYVRLVMVNSQGKVANLFPNTYHLDNYALPGRKYQIPTKNAAFTLKIKGPAGTDKIRAIAGVKPITVEDAQLNSDGTFKIDPASNNLAMAKHNIIVHKKIREEN